MAVADARNASVLNQEPHVLTACHVEEDANIEDNARLDVAVHGF